MEDQLHVDLMLNKAAGCWGVVRQRSWNQAEVAGLLERSCVDLGDG